MEKQKNFIATSDYATKELLEKEGFQLINSSDGKYIFLNCPNKFMFADSKVVFTDKLCI